MSSAQPLDEAAGGAAFRLGLLHGVLCAVNLGAIVLDAQRRIVLWNSWMVRHSGIDHDAALGQDLFALYPALRGGRVESAVQQALHNHFPSLLSQSLNKAPFPLHADAAGATAAGPRLQQAVEVTPI